MVGRDLNEFVVLINGLVAPRTIRNLTNFGERTTSILAQRSYLVLSEGVALRDLGVLALREEEIVIICSRTT